MSGYVVNIRFQSDRLTAKKNTNGEMVVFHPIEGELAFITAVEARLLAEWILKSFPEKDKEENEEDK